MELSTTHDEPPVIRAMRQPPGPSGHWALGNARALQQDMVNFLLDVKRQYGHSARVRILPSWYGLIFTHPEHYKHVLVTRNGVYDKKTREFVLLEALIGESVVTANGSYWRQQRKLALPAFHREQIASFGEIMTRCAQGLVTGWLTRKPGALIDAELEMTRVTVTIASRALLGVELAGRAAAIGQCFMHANQYISERFVKALSPWLMKLPRALNPSFAASVDPLDRLVHAMIEERRADTRPHNDLLNMFLEAKDADTGQPLTDVQVRDEVVTYMFAGHETSATVLTWAFYLLSKHPEQEAKLHAEVDGVLNGRPPTLADVPKLKYAKMIVEEVLRLYPPGYVMSRRATEDDSISGYDIPRGTQVFLSPYVTHRDPEFWDDPESFEPERFRPELARGRHMFAYIPFGFGPRRCIGSEFAMAEIMVLLSSIAQQFKLRLVPGHVVEKVPRVTIRPRNGMPMTLERRFQD